MAITTIFENPTVKQVLFEVKFPNLFYLESKIGDLQMKIMEHFPDSELLYRRQVVFADLGPESKITELTNKEGENSGKKIWQFKSPKNYVLNVTSNSLDISSGYHKTYSLGDGDKFRDIIKFVIDSFLATVPIPTFSRMGLRYIDECPIPTKDNETFKSYYNTAFPVDRFNISDATEMDFKTVVKRGPSSLRYIESLRKTIDEDNYKLIMDFDGFQENVASATYLETSDNLHTLIAEEFEKSIKKPLIDYMNQPKEMGK